MAKMHITDKNKLVIKSSDMYKLLALDLDGTVLNSANTISAALKETIKSISKDVMVVIVTGRHHTAAEPYYNELGLTTPIICCNGTYVYDYQSKSVLAENSISKKNAREFIALSELYSLKKVMYVQDTMTYSLDQPIEYMKALKEWSLSFPEANRPSIKQINNFNEELEITPYIWKFVVEGEGDNIEEFSSLPFIKKHFIGERSWHNRIDFSHEGNSKGNRLGRFIKAYDIQAEQVVAIGDNHNDISMIEFSGLGIAMLNAEPVVKDSADQVCETDNNDQHGLAQLIDRIFKP
jgi:Cof subfamily protein (haloacid dehalogenase superfamily)